MFKTDCQYYIPLSNEDKGVEIAQCNGDCTVIYRCSLDCCGYKKNVHKTLAPISKLREGIPININEYIVKLDNKIDKLEERIERLELNSAEIKGIKRLI